MDALITFWSHALAAACFAALMIWRLGEAARQPAQRLLAGRIRAHRLLGMARRGGTRRSQILGFAESARNLVWISLLYSLSAASEEREHGLKLVYAAVAGVIGLQLIGDTLQLFSPSEAIAQTGLMLRITTAAGALVLVHNLYGQAAPASRSHIRFAMLGLALIWIYDLNLYTSIYLGSGERQRPARMARDRGRACRTACSRLRPASRAAGASGCRALRPSSRSRCSRSAPISRVMAILATALRGTGVDWSSALMVGVLALMTVGAMVLIPSARARGWVKVKLAKHLFEHRYDYRAEWLRFTETLGLAGPDAPPLSERIVKAFADIVDAPGGLLLVSDGGRGICRRHRQRLARRRPRRRAPSTMPAISGTRSRRAAASSSSKRLRGGWASSARQGAHSPALAARGAACLGRHPAAPPSAAGRPRRPRRARISPPARLGGFRPAAHGGPPGRELARRGARTGSAQPGPALRGVQPPLRLHPSRHQESGQPAVAARAQCRAARRQSRIPRRHGRDAASRRSAR